MGIRTDRRIVLKERNNKILKSISLFIFLGILVVICSTITAISLFKNINNVNAQKRETSENILAVKNDSVSDDVVFLEKYLQQQIEGQMPDGADGKKVAYLTFDDGPSESVTPIILDILKSENIKATFFVVGSSIDSSEITKDILKREVQDGHAIGNHTYSHDYEYLYPNRIVDVKNFMSDIEKTNRSLKSVLGEDFSTRVIRFPGGYISWDDPNGINEVLINNGYHHVDWNSLSKDSEGLNKSSEELIQEVKESVNGREKAIILMHDNYGKEETAKALPEIIEYLREQGYEFRTIK